MKKIPVLFFAIIIIIGIASFSLKYVFGYIHLFGISFDILSLTSMILALLSVLYQMLTMIASSKTPTTIAISLLGFPLTGKTVYLTVLFNEILVNNRLENVSLYGNETVERVAKDYATLQKGEWLPPTGSDVFYYRAITKTKSSSLRTKYKIEVADYAGEMLQKDLLQNDNYLHRTQYFKYVVTSDILFLAIDLEKYSGGKHENSDIMEKSEYVFEIEKSLIAALQVYIEEKSMLSKKKAKTPIALLFLKSDCLTDIDKDIAIAKETVTSSFHRLIKYCENHFMYFEHYFVYSISTEPLHGHIPAKIEPVNVTPPLEWVIDHINRTMF